MRPIFEHLDENTLPGSDAQKLQNIKYYLDDWTDIFCEYFIDSNAGYEVVAGVWLSVSCSAQIKWAGFRLASGSLSYPFDVPTKDDLQLHSVADAAAIDTIHDGIVGITQGLLETANTTKQAINADTTIENAKTEFDTYAGT